MKRYTEKKAAAYMNKVLNSARRNTKTSINGNRIYKYFINSWKDLDGNCFACDGYKICKLYAGYPDGITDIWSVHVLTNEQKKEMEYQHKTIVQRTLETFYTTARQEVNSLSIDYVRDNKNELDSIQLPGGENMPFYSAYYLIDVINLFPDGKWYILPEKGKYSPLYVTDNKNGEVYIMPVRYQKKTETEGKTAC